MSAVANSAWGGRFGKGPDADLLRFSDSLSEDEILVPFDVAGSVAHAEALAAGGVVTRAEADALQAGLRAVFVELASGRARLVREHEDVHMNVEVLLRAKIGEVAGKLHTARSRNDQVALDTRLFARAALAELAGALLDHAEALLDQASRTAEVAMPGFTHLQPAQPIVAGHLFHARAVQAVRDAERALDAFAVANVSPLGAGALAGTSFAIEPAIAARALGFDSAFANSLDAVGDRDFVLDALHAALQAHLHLAGFAEELVLFTSPAYAFVKLPDEWTTGSSIMPQKRNPDAAELLRGRTGRLLGAYTQVATTVKALPLAYNRDLQEVKAPLLRGLADAIDAARVAGALARGLAVDEAACAAALRRGFLEATEVADHLAKRGVPFREAHHVAGRLVALAESRGVTLHDLAWSDFELAHPAFTRDVLPFLEARAVPGAKTSPGGTAPSRVREAVKAARASVESSRARLARAQAKCAAVDALLARPPSGSLPSPGKKESP